MTTTERPIYFERIVTDPDIMVGMPTVRVTRIPVELVLEQLTYNLDLYELFAAYPRLARGVASISAALVTPSSTAFRG